MKVTLTGDKQLIVNIRKFGEQTEKELANIIKATAIDTRTHAVKSIRGGPKNGRTYKKSNPNRVHRASSPGQAPATDQGFLADAIDFDITGLTATVGVRGAGRTREGATIEDYALALEFGTTKMAPRPFMNPALEAQRDRFNGRLEKLSDEASKGLAP